MLMVQLRAGRGRRTCSVISFESKSLLALLSTANKCPFLPPLDTTPGSPSRAARLYTPLLAVLTSAVLFVSSCAGPPAFVGISVWLELRSMKDATGLTVSACAEGICGQSQAHPGERYAIAPIDFPLVAERTKLATTFTIKRSDGTDYYPPREVLLHPGPDDASSRPVNRGSRIANVIIAPSGITEGRPESAGR